MSCFGSKHELLQVADHVIAHYYRSKKGYLYVAIRCFLLYSVTFLQQENALDKRALSYKYSFLIAMTLSTICRSCCVCSGDNSLMT